MKTAIEEQLKEYLNDEVPMKESHKFIIEKAREYPPFTQFGLNQLPHALMPAVAICMEQWAEYKNQSQPIEKEQDTTDWHYQFRELSKSHVAQANLIHNLKCQLSDFLESSTKRETGTHPGRKKSKRKS